jgi:hypothetical protein
LKGVLIPELWTGKLEDWETFLGAFKRKSSQVQSMRVELKNPALAKVMDEFLSGKTADVSWKSVKSYVESVFFPKIQTKKIKRMVITRQQKQQSVREFYVKFLHNTGFEEDFRMVLFVNQLWPDIRQLVEANDD